MPSTSACARAMRPRHSVISSPAAVHARREHVDVEVVALELGEDVAQLGHRVGVTDLARPVTHRRPPRLPPTRLMTRPLARAR